VSRPSLIGKKKRRYIPLKREPHHEPPKRPDIPLGIRSNGAKKFSPRLGGRENITRPVPTASTAGRFLSSPRAKSKRQTKQRKEEERGLRRGPGERLSARTPGCPLVIFARGNAQALGERRVMGAKRKGKNGLGARKRFHGAEGVKA